MRHILIFLAVALCLNIILMVTADIWRRKQITTNWIFQTVRRHKNTSIAVESANSKSPTGCAAVCTAIEGLVVPSLYFTPETGECVCNSAVDNTSEDIAQPKRVYGTLKDLEQIEVTDTSYEKIIVWPYKHDCHELYIASYNADCVYAIQPNGGYLTDAWCRMSQGGLTIIQRRMDGSEDFYRGWDDYVMGFGNRTGEYWLGLENIYHLTKYTSWLFIYMEAYPGITPRTMSAYYNHFKIGDVSSGFALDTAAPFITCGDAMADSNGQSFTTYDNDNDNWSSGNCAVNSTGAWWYNNCHCGHLNGVYYREGEYSRENVCKGIHWCKCWEFTQSSKFTLMAVMPTPIRATHQ